MAVRMNLKKLDRGEILWCTRKQMGWTQARAANEIGMNLKHFQKIERGEIYASSGIIKMTYSVGVLCSLARRRHGGPLLATAASLGLSHVTLLLWERESDPRLAAKWRKLGFQF